MALAAAFLLGVLLFGDDAASAQETTPDTRLETVKNVSAAPGPVPDTVLLQWDPVADAAAYWIYLEMSRGYRGRFWERAFDGSLSLETITGLEGGREYNFYVVAASADGRMSERSEEATATPEKADPETVRYNNHNHRVALVLYAQPYGDELHIAIAIVDPTDSLHRSTEIIKIKAQIVVNMLDRYFGSDDWTSQNNFYSGTYAPATNPPGGPRSTFNAGDLYLKTDDCNICQHDGSAWGKTPIMAMQCD